MTIYTCIQENENILVSAGGDGKIKAWDIRRPPQANPLRSLEEHTHEVGHMGRLWCVHCFFGWLYFFSWLYVVSYAQHAWA